MPIIEITERDILRSKVIQPDWYRIRIDSIGSSPSKAGDSINYVVEGTILSNWQGETDFANVPTPYWNFNSKAMGFMIGFLESLGVEVQPGKRFEINNAVGKEIEMFIKNEMYEDRMVNKSTHQYRKVGAGGGDA